MSAIAPVGPEVSLTQIVAGSRPHVTARDVMSSPVVCVRADVTLWRARQVLTNAGFRHLVVLADDRCIGVIDERDVTASILTFDGGRGTVRDILRPESYVVWEETPIEEVAELVLRSPCYAVAVVDADGHPIGLVTASDVVALVAGRIDVAG